MGIGLYIHIPFCQSRCGYCDFATYTYQEDHLDRYCKALSYEMNQVPSKVIDTLFLGGGTPTVLSVKQIESLFSNLRSHHKWDGLSEATVEANPESATEERLLAFQREGINRLSFGIQDSHDRLLKSMDRLHSWDQGREVFQKARSLNFNNINLDLIFGLPGQSLSDWDQTLIDVMGLGPEHISLYALKIESGTPFDKAGITVDQDLQADMYIRASEILTREGYDHYEISNFAKPGFACQHNLKYWKNEETMGLGLSAASFLDGERRTNPRGLWEYIEGMEPQGDLNPSLVRLSPEDREKEDVMLGLRLKEGVPYHQIEKMCLPIFQSFIDQKLAFIQDDRYVLNPKGWLLSNQLFQFLI
ncbi:hypothetical protein BVX98_02845 [bacterium F11]|nr:hypothetical protein BVX98_02845 [bacterium F11]